MMNSRGPLIVAALLAVTMAAACGPRRPEGVSETEFKAIMNRLADAWTRQDTERALACFTEDALYMEPPDIQLYEGHAQLRPYFAALKPGTFMRFHNLWFDEVRQTGAGEYSFGEQADKTADHGVVVVELRHGRIAVWREYQQKGPVGFEEFIDKANKQWRWTIKNYP